MRGAEEGLGAGRPTSVLVPPTKCRFRMVLEHRGQATKNTAHGRRLQMVDMPDAADLRRRAKRCAEQAESIKEAEQRERLLRMHRALMELAETRDWLDGQA
jgi:hypothetical protein